MNVSYRSMIIVFTHVDMVESGKDIDTVVKNCTISTIRALLEECDNRYIAINNMADGTNIAKQREELIKKILPLTPYNYDISSRRKTGWLKSVYHWLKKQPELQKQIQHSAQPDDNKWGNVDFEKSSPDSIESGTN